MYRATCDALRPRWRFARVRGRLLARCSEPVWRDVVLVLNQPKLNNLPGPSCLEIPKCRGSPARTPKQDGLVYKIYVSDSRYVLKDVKRMSRSIGWNRLFFSNFRTCIASRLEAIALRLEANALRLEATTTRVEAIASRVEAIASRPYIDNATNPFLFSIYILISAPR